MQASPSKIVVTILWTTCLWFGCNINEEEMRFKIEWSDWYCWLDQVKKEGHLLYFYDAKILQVLVENRPNFRSLVMYDVGKVAMAAVTSRVTGAFTFLYLILILAECAFLSTVYSAYKYSGLS